MPFWVSIILALFGIIYFRYYWESTILLFISDLLYGIKEDRFWDIYIISFFISFIVLLIAEMLKKKIRFSKQEIK